MKNMDLLNTGDGRFLRYYTRYLHVKLECEGAASNMTSYTKKSLVKNLALMLKKLEDKDPSDFNNQCLLMNDYVKKDLLDFTFFEWINSDRASHFVWLLLRGEELTFDAELESGRSKWQFLTNNAHSHLCFNTNTNIFDYILWSFDDTDNSYINLSGFNSTNLRELGALQRFQKRLLSDYKKQYRFVYDSNNISWIHENDLEQTSWIYNYILKQMVSGKHAQLQHLDKFHHITPPTNEAQFYATVVAQLDMICNAYSAEPLKWNQFSRKLRKAWSTQSERLKTKNSEVMLDKECIKMLRDIVGKGASDAALKKKIKDVIKAGHEEYMKMG